MRTGLVRQHETAESGAAGAPSRPINQKLVDRGQHHSLPGRLAFERR